MAVSRACAGACRWTRLLAPLSATQRQTAAWVPTCHSRRRMSGSSARDSGDAASAAVAKAIRSQVVSDAHRGRCDDGMTGRALGHAWPQLAKTGPRLITDGHMMPICVARYLVSNSVFMQLLILQSPHCMQARVVSRRALHDLHRALTSSRVFMMYACAHLPRREEHRGRFNKGGV